MTVELILAALQVINSLIQLRLRTLDAMTPEQRVADLQPGIDFELALAKQASALLALLSNLKPPTA